MSECNVCAEKYNKTKRAQVTCRCDYSACRSCIKTYLLHKIENAHCMNCKVEWDRKFMTDNFEKSFMSKGYRDHRRQVLIERELGMLQATQPYVEREIKIDKVNLEMKQTREKLKECEVRRKKIKELKILCTDCKFLKDNFDKTKIERKLLREKLLQLLNLRNELYTKSTIPEHKKFVQKCPYNECLGFLSSALKCELCENFTCVHCHEVSGKTSIEREAHNCNPEIVESIKFLKKDSKPCPKCASITFKIEGCSQMYCVECHTPWDWNSGRIVNGPIHNPHYFEFLARQNNGRIPRNPNDILCGREIDYEFILQLSLNNNTFVEIARNIIHIRHVEVPRFETLNGLDDNLELRIKYMRNKIGKQTFEKRIQEKEKKNIKNNEIANVLNMYVNCMTDILYRLVNNPEASQTIKEEINALKDYVNESLQRISSTFNSKTYKLNQNFVFS